MLTGRIGASFSNTVKLLSSGTVKVTELEYEEILYDSKEEAEDGNSAAIEILEGITADDTVVGLACEDLSGDGISDEKKIDEEKDLVTDVSNISYELDSVHLLQTVSVSVTLLKLL
ncbi:unnamed protein product [[Candida] boidinii]|nr:unnamed protein product [[Candida] boidinii]